jgi:hypothetical protein
MNSDRAFSWTRRALIGATVLASAAMTVPALAQAPQQQKPNIVLIVSDDTGYGDLGPYGGGVGRGMPTPGIDRLAAEGMTFMSFYAQPSCTPGRAAMQTGRIPNRSGMTTVAFQGQGGGLPAAEWTWVRCSSRRDTTPSSPASGTSGRRITRCPTPRATTR